MEGSSQGSGYPGQESTFRSNKSSQSVLTCANRTGDRSACRTTHMRCSRPTLRAWVQHVGAVSPTVPVWPSRAGWLVSAQRWAVSSAGTAVLAKHHLSVKLFLTVIAVLARFADSATGRNCAVTNTRAAAKARCSPRSITTVRAVLAEAGLAVEVYRGHGSTATPSGGRRPSVWHLISHRQAVDNYTVCDLPPSRRDEGLTPVCSNSPSVRSRAALGHLSQPPAKRTATSTRRDDLPRPLAVQRLAAQLAARAHGLDRPGLHIGQLCNAIVSARIDAEQWTVQGLQAALDADMRASGTFWPDRINNPAAFLATRLRRLPSVPPSQPSSVVLSPAQRFRPPPPAPHQPVVPPEAQQQRIAQAKAEIRRILNRNRCTNLLKTQPDEGAADVQVVVGT